MANAPDLEAPVVAAQVGWLALCGEMLFSRFVFQAAGPLWMRSFLDRWKFSKTHRAWGWTAFATGLTLLGWAGLRWRGLDAAGAALVVALVAVLCADGLLNLFPRGFGHFKEKMQDAWVKRHQGSERASDKNLFGTVNFFLGAASVAAGALVYFYRPLPPVLLALALVLAAALMWGLIAACNREARGLHGEIAVWATEHAGTGLDLDEDLERAGIEAVDAPSSRGGETTSSGRPWHPPGPSTSRHPPP